ncbi:tRNA(Ile)-lysidine synthase [Thermaurantimonas aggregans]|uniref:tRNA(Ile)-lysidine synthase n=2 Tax=Thermaurantimonas aggregans TaxID=2173829 RepID=A0A401XJ69_9FLAO|nr:tRNA(Ile)-lysidine synthase [Thermaurantimonas aggregans]
MSLLTLFHLHQFKAIAVHVNYHLRGEESDADEELVKSYCKRLGIPLHIIHFQKEREILKSESLQMAARRFRYEKFEWVRIQEKADFIALAHHFDDWVETFFLHLSRGSGLRGLVQPPDDSLIIRPLRLASKGDILQFAQAYAVPWREDASNSTSKYERNRIRNEVLPLLQSIHPRVATGLRHTFENLEVTFKYLHLQAQEYLRLYKFLIFQGYKISLKPLLPWREEYGALLQEILFLEELPISDLNSLSKALTTTESKIWHIGFPLIFSRNAELYIYPNEHRFNKISVEKVWTDLQKPCDLSGWGRVYVTDQDADAWMSLDPQNTKILFRPWHSEDFILIPNSGRKKVSALLKDKKLTLVQRNKTLVMTVNGEVAWVVGLQVDGRFKAKPGQGIGLKAVSGWLE